MGVTTDLELPELTNLGECWACGARVGWVQLASNHWCAVDPNPAERGPIALLSDGIRAIDLRPIDPSPRHQWMDEHHSGPRFWDHKRNCKASGVRLAGWVASHFDRTPDPIKEARRQAGLEADRLRDRGIDPSAR